MKSFLLSLLALVMTAAVASAAVEDKAHFFSDGAIDQANKAITQIDGQYHKQVSIETFPGIPDDLKADYDPSNLKAFFEKWSSQRFKEDGVDGVYVLICKDPPYLKTRVGVNTAKHAFTAANRDELSRRMLAKFKEKQYDDALTDGINFIQSTITANKAAFDQSQSQRSSSGAPMYPPSNTTSYPPGNSSPTINHTGGSLGIGWFGIIFAIFILFILLRVITGIFRRFGGGGMGGMGGNVPGSMGGNYQNTGGGFGGGYGGGGGGFGRGLLGGLLGGAAGSWLYDRERNNGGNSSTSGNWGGGGPADTGSSGGSFGSGSSDTFGGGNDAGMSAPSDSGDGGSFGGGGDSGGGGGGGGDSSGGSF